MRHARTPYSFGSRDTTASPPTARMDPLKAASARTISVGFVADSLDTDGLRPTEMKPPATETNRPSRLAEHNESI
jgi:hypothetical protein